jgi:hypothetical protein
MSRILSVKSLLCCVFFFVLINPTSAQDDAVPMGALSAPIYGGTTGGGHEMPLTDDDDKGGGDLIRRHRDLAGKPCLSVYGYATPHAVDTNLFDHTVRANNKCAQLIKIQVCYFQTQDCISMDVPGDTTEEAVLGIFPSIKDFRFEFRERF